MSMDSYMMKYFTLQEMSRSYMANELGIDNRIPEEYEANVIALIQNVLDPIREAWGAPITVSSGYRCPELNKAVGGSKTSQHMLGMAADLDIGMCVDNRKLFQFIQTLDIDFDQLIDERKYRWIHISYNPNGKNRRQVKHL